MDRTTFCVAWAWVLAFCSAASATDPGPPIPVGVAPAVGQYIVQIKMLRTGNDGSKSVLAAPTLIVPPNRQAFFRSGGEQTAGGEQVPFGTAARLTVTAADDGKVLLVGTVENSVVVDRGNGVLSRHSDETFFKQSIALGKVMRLSVSSTPDATQWVELTVKAAGQSAEANSAPLSTEP